LVSYRQRMVKVRVVPAIAAASDVMKLVTLADVLALLEKYLPKDPRERPTWRHVAAEIDKAAAGGDMADVSIALRLALMLEGVECQPK
jgi:hypothetical protein